MITDKQRQHRKRVAESRKKRIKSVDMHHRSRVAFSVIDQARDLREVELLSRRAIKEYIWFDHGIKVNPNTLDDWLYYRTRVYR